MHQSPARLPPTPDPPQPARPRPSPSPAPPSPRATAALAVLEAAQAELGLQLTSSGLARALTDPVQGDLAAGELVPSVYRSWLRPPSLAQVDGAGGTALDLGDGDQVVFLGRGVAEFTATDFVLG